MTITIRHTESGRCSRGKDGSMEQLCLKKPTKYVLALNLFELSVHHIDWLRRSLVVGSASHENTKFEK